jgi:hypothetical protein
LVDDDLEFAHLQTDTRMVSEDEDGETGEVVLTEDLNTELREAARNREVSHTTLPLLLISLIFDRLSKLLIWRTHHGSTGRTTSMIIMFLSK